MREIKFRAWDEANKDMVCQSTGLYGLSNGNILLRFSNVMQYTGLKDRNGKEIYEGDIVQFDLPKLDSEHPERRGLKGEVKCSNLGDLTFDGWTSSFATNINVLGNIHEHPQLINQ